MIINDIFPTVSEGRHKRGARMRAATPSAATEPPPRGNFEHRLQQSHDLRKTHRDQERRRFRSLTHASLHSLDYVQRDAATSELVVENLPRLVGDPHPGDPGSHEKQYEDFAIMAEPLQSQQQLQHDQLCHTLDRALHFGAALPAAVPRVPFGQLRLARDVEQARSLDWSNAQVSMDPMQPLQARVFISRDMRTQDTYLVRVGKTYPHKPPVVLTEMGQVSLDLNEWSPVNTLVEIVQSLGGVLESGEGAP